MSEFQIKLDTSNAAFDPPDEGAHEIARILHNVAAEIEEGSSYGRLKDINGNRVGSWAWVADKGEPV